jgi:hypothetical protein
MLLSTQIGTPLKFNRGRVYSAVFSPDGRQDSHTAVKIAPCASGIYKAIFDISKDLFLLQIRCYILEQNLTGKLMKFNLYQKISGLS